jgi:hypothetical protein
MFDVGRSMFAANPAAAGVNRRYLKLLRKLFRCREDVPINKAPTGSLYRP